MERGQKIYLASPFFTEEQKKIMEAVLGKLRKMGYDVVAPYEFIVADGKNMSNEQWGRIIFEQDVSDLRSCDYVVAINHGMDSDSGTAWEIGYACGIGIPVLVLCFKDRTNSLMVVNSAMWTMYIAEFLMDNFQKIEDAKYYETMEEQK